MSGRDRNSVASVEKALVIWRALGRSPAPLSVRDVADTVGVSHTSCYRIMRALEKSGAVARAEDSRFTIGHLAYELAAGNEPHQRMRAAAGGPMLTIRQQCGGETVGLYVPVNSTEVVCVESLSGWHEIRHTEVLYRPILLGRGATSLVFLADMLTRHGDDAVIHYLAGLPPPALALPVPDLLALVHRVAEVGHALSQGTRIPGLAALSVPVYGQLDRTVAAVTLSFPAERRPDDLGEWISELTAGSRRIAERLIHSGAS